MATESKRFKYEPIPGVHEISQEEVAQQWISHLPKDMESFYRALPQQDEARRKQWADAVRIHPFEISSEQQLQSFDEMVDAGSMEQSRLDFVQRELLIEVIEHRLPPLAEQLNTSSAEIALALIDASKVNTSASLHALRDQMTELIADRARMAKLEDPALVKQTTETVVPLLVNYLALRQEEARRDGTESMTRFTADQVQALRENPNLLRMQMRAVDPDEATISDVIDKTGFPPKEATYALKWIRSPQPSIEQTYPKQAFADVQKRAALERTLELLAGYPHSMVVPQDIGLDPALEAQGRPVRMFVQLRKAITEDAAMIPKLRERGQEHTREQDRQARAYNHEMDVYTAQVLPKTMMAVVGEYQHFATAETMQDRQRYAIRMAYQLSERFPELAELEDGRDGHPVVPEGVALGQAAATASRKVRSFLETAYRTWNRDSNHLSRFLDGITDEVTHIMEARLRQAALKRTIEGITRAMASGELSKEQIEARRRDFDRLRLDEALVAKKLKRYKEGDLEA